MRLISPKNPMFVLKNLRVVIFFIFLTFFEAFFPHLKAPYFCSLILGFWINNVKYIRDELIDPPDT